MCGEKRCISFIHKVEPGDTLYQIGNKYHVKVAALIFANPYTDVYQLRPGDEICIPGNSAFLKKV